jgi:hypothetical protein
MGVKGRLVLPAFDDGKAVGPVRLLQDSELDIFRFVAAGFTVLLEQVDALAERVCTDVEISHGIDRLADGLALCRRGDGDRETDGHCRCPGPIGANDLADDNF